MVHPPGERFDAIEDAAAVTKLPVTRITREIDPLVRRSDELGFLNGHVPITAVITAAALVAAVLDRRDAVVLSNEWSASVPTLVHEGRPVNHQWSKGMEFEEGFAHLVERSLGPALSVFSYLRSRSELWVAMQFSGLREYHRVFRSCNRAFHQDRTARLGRWCGRCDKCCFIDLILAPFMTRRRTERRSSTGTSRWKISAWRTASLTCWDSTPMTNPSSAWATRASAVPPCSMRRRVLIARTRRYWKRWPIACTTNPG